MHPTLVARAFHRKGWVYEEKYDGWRLTFLTGRCSAFTTVLVLRD